MYCHGCESENIFLHLPPSQSQMYSGPCFLAISIEKEKMMKMKSHRHCFITSVFQNFVFYNLGTLIQNSGLCLVISKLNLHPLSCVYCEAAECVRSL